MTFHRVSLRAFHALTLTLALGLLMPARVRATVIVAADLDELCRDARAIARGRVTGLDARWTDDRRTVETIVTLDVESYLKGSLGETLQFRVPGGELGRFRSITVGAPTFALDDRIVVFLGVDGPSIPHVLGFNQGIYRLVPAPDGWVVTPPPALPSAATAVRIVRGDVSRRPQPLAQFEQHVRAAALERR